MKSDSKGHFVQVTMIWTCRTCDPLNEANTYVKPSDGSRHCRICHRERERARRQRAAS